MKFIGITGGIGAGKSTVLSLLKENFNCKVVLADEVAAELLTPEHLCLEQVASLPWPESILTEAGEINRPLMAKYMFASDSLREQVNEIVHPAVEKEVLNQVEIEREKHKEKDDRKISPEFSRKGAPAGKTGSRYHDRKQDEGEKL